MYETIRKPKACVEVQGIFVQLDDHPTLTVTLNCRSHDQRLLEAAVKALLEVPRILAKLPWTAILYDLLLEIEGCVAFV